MKFIDSHTILGSKIVLFKDRYLIIDIRDGDNDLSKGVSGFSRSKSKLVIIISLNNQGELVLNFPIQRLGPSIEFTGVWIDPEPSKIIVIGLVKEVSDFSWNYKNLE